ncbi:hypothetical protein KGA66_17800 [Actinocrinis puniceicyclus]|uniref:Uncharacterized protein n=1 Tax=Actinocrinis puniceicyclus TaxID=977794 RepID=A0A8J8BDW7_9ACTN|nr:hypothetical protein [Actinocrinis puniceicyclus]MBS2964915.1 hypothetical protein [Actinocrinis puniceicyclus]
MRPRRFRFQAVLFAAWLIGAALVVPAVGTSPGRAAQREATGGDPATHHVVVIGIDGLQWSDVTRTGMPHLFDLVKHADIASLVTRGESDYTCPADGWLTLNSGTRSTGGTVLRYPPGTDAVTALITQPQQYCAPLPDVPLYPGAYDIPDFSSYTTPNNAYSYVPVFGSLEAPITASGGCVAASGAGALLGAADAQGRVGDYLGEPGALSRADLSQCALTLVDLGGVTDVPPTTVPLLPRPPVDRAAPYGALDSALGSLLSRIPADATVVVAGLDDSTDQAQLHAVLVKGQPYDGEHWLYAPSTRHAGLVQTLDLTASLPAWTGLDPRQIRAADPKPFVGSQITVRANRPADPAGAIVTQVWLNTANQTFAQTNGRFVTWMAHAITVLAWAAGLIFAAVRWLPERYGPGRFARRRPLARRWRSGLIGALAGWATVLGAVAPASFLANLVNWSATFAPGPVLYGATAGISVLLATAVLAACRLSPSLRRQPLAPAGLLGLLTLLVIAGDVATGSRLQAQTPFGLSYVIAGRFYGIGNSAVGVYCAAAMIGAAWLAALLLPRRGPGQIPPHVWPNTLREAADGWLRRAVPGRLGLTRLPEAARGERRRALAVVGAVALAAIAACGYPGWGAKFGGTIAMVPGFVLLLFLVAGLRITWRRALVVALSGIVVVSGFALLNYLQPAAERSHFGSFVASLFDGTWTGTIHRKIATNLASIHNDWFSHYVPWLLFWSLLAIVAPRLIGSRSLALVYAREPFVRCALWLALITVAIGWFVDDSGVLVPKMALFLAAPLGVLSAALTLRPDAAERDARPDTRAAAGAAQPVPGPGRVAGQSPGDQ